MIWYSYLMLLIFGVMVISPAWFFRKVERFLFDDPNKDDYLVVENYISPSNVTLRYREEEVALLRDEKILNNLNMMVKTSRKREVKNMWKIKRAEFLREMHWKRLSAKINRG